VDAKSSTMAAMIPQALATGNCELRTGCTAAKVAHNEQGRVTQVEYWDAEGNYQAQRAKAVVLCANGAETPRLLLLSESPQHPDGLANSSGMVGKNLMFNGSSRTVGLFEHPVNGWKSIPATRVIHDFYEIDPSEGFYGGGGIDSRHPSRGAPMAFAMGAPALGGKSWGGEFKKNLARDFSHMAAFSGHTTSIPMSRNNVSLDPTYKDKWGRPVLRTTFQDHPDDIACMSFFNDRCNELMEAAGAIEYEGFHRQQSGGGVHLLGTCRMGDNPDNSVVDKYNRAHDVPNLFMVDGSSLVTSSRGQPTMTIMALSFRAADNIIQAARRGDI
jgi:choline dehydrogenase-like flavoprotein